MSARRVLLACVKLAVLMSAECDAGGRRGGGRGLFIIGGESFRSGGQDSRIRGSKDSYRPQLDATKSHLRLIERSYAHFGCAVDVHVETYTCRFTTELLEAYKPYLISHNLYENESFVPRGIDSLFRNGLASCDIEKYVYIFFCRFDMIRHALQVTVLGGVQPVRSSNNVAFHGMVAAAPRSWPPQSESRIRVRAERIFSCAPEIENQP